MKKIIFGALLTVVGLVFSAFCFIHATINPWDYNGIGGLLGSFLGTRTLAPFIIGLAVMVSGLSIVGYEAYAKK